jgi:hypothetical protein
LPTPELPIISLLVPGRMQLIDPRPSFDFLQFRAEAFQLFLFSRRPFFDIDNRLSQHNIHIR